MLLESIIRTVEPAIPVVEVSGRLQLGNTLQALESSLKDMIEGGTRKLVVDVTRLATIDSSRIGMLIGCYGHREQPGGKFRVAGAQGTVAKVFAVVHMERIIPLNANVEAACSSLS